VVAGLRLAQSEDVAVAAGMRVAEAKMSAVDWRPLWEIGGKGDYARVKDWRHD
jgi:hypothetical protein